MTLLWSAFLGEAQHLPSGTFAGRYLGMLPGPAVDQACVVIAFAIGLGILAEISRSLCR